METTDWASILGIAGGISAAIFIVYFAIAVTYRSHRQSQNGHRPNKTDNSRISNLKITTNPVDQHNNDDPDIIINSNSGKSGCYIIRNKIRNYSVLLYFDFVNYSAGTAESHLNDSHRTGNRL